MGKFQIGPDQIGMAYIIDGTAPHYSKAFQGTRYSMVYFTHKSAVKLSDKDKLKLKSLGFTAQLDTPKNEESKDKLNAEQVKRERDDPRVDIPTAANRPTNLDCDIRPMNLDADPKSISVDATNL